VIMADGATCARAADTPARRMVDENGARTTLTSGLAWSASQGPGPARTPTRAGSSLTLGGGAGHDVVHV
jgi:hypothetical protein